MTEFKSGSAEYRKRQRAAHKAALAAGWRAVGSTYTHETNGTYRMKDMDGWSDLCEVEAIEVAQR